MKHALILSERVEIDSPDLPNCWILFFKLDYCIKNYILLFLWADLCFYLEGRLTTIPKVSVIPLWSISYYDIGDVGYPLNHNNLSKEI